MFLSLFFAFTATVAAHPFPSYPVFPPMPQCDFYGCWHLDFQRGSIQSPGVQQFGGVGAIGGNHRGVYRLPFGMSSNRSPGVQQYDGLGDFTGASSNQFGVFQFDAFGNLIGANGQGALGAGGGFGNGFGLGNGSGESGSATQGQLNALKRKIGAITGLSGDLLDRFTNFLRGRFGDSLFDMNLPDLTAALNGIDFSLPDIRASLPGLPDGFGLSDFAIPDIDLPEFNRPDFNRPNIDLPNGGGNRTRGNTGRTGGGTGGMNGGTGGSTAGSDGGAGGGGSPRLSRPLFPKCESIHDSIDTGIFGPAPCTWYPGVFGGVPDVGRN